MNNIYIGDHQLEQCYIDTKKVTKIYLDTILIWEVSEPVSITNQQNQVWANNECSVD